MQVFSQPVSQRVGRSSLSIWTIILALYIGLGSGVRSSERLAGSFPSAGSLALDRLVGSFLLTGSLALDKLVDELGLVWAWVSPTMFLPSI